MNSTFAFSCCLNKEFPLLVDLSLNAATAALLRFYAFSVDLDFPFWTEASFHAFDWKYRSLLTLIAACQRVHWSTCFVLLARLALNC